MSDDIEYTYLKPEPFAMSPATDEQGRPASEISIRGERFVVCIENVPAIVAYLMNHCEIHLTELMYQVQQQGMSCWGVKYHMALMGSVGLAPVVGE